MRIRFCTSVSSTPNVASCRWIVRFSECSVRFAVKKARDDPLRNRERMRRRAERLRIQTEINDQPPRRAGHPAEIGVRRRDLRVVNFHLNPLRLAEGAGGRLAGFGSTAGGVGAYLQVDTASWPREYSSRKIKDGLSFGTNNRGIICTPDRRLCPLLCFFQKRGKVPAKTLPIIPTALFGRIPQLDCAEHQSPQTNCR